MATVYAALGDTTAALDWLEDWFDERRLRADYVPTGFNARGIGSRAVTGHPFGLHMSTDDKQALIAFLRTL